MTRTPRARPPQRVVGAAGADEMQRDGGSPTSALREDELKRVREREREREREMVSMDAEAAGGGPHSLQGSSACKKWVCFGVSP